MICKDLIKNTVKVQITVFYFNILSLLQSLVSHDPSEIILICWFGDQETFLIIIYIEKVVLLNISAETIIHFISGFFYLKNV